MEVTFLRTHKEIEPFTKRISGCLPFVGHLIISMNGGMNLIANLTEREIEIVEALSRGLSSEEISDKFIISVFTVNTHRRNAMEKLHAKNAPHMVRICLEEGLIQAYQAEKWALYQ